MGVCDLALGHLEVNLAIAAGVDRTRRDKVWGLAQKPTFDGEKSLIGGDDLPHLVIIAAVHFITRVAEELMSDWIHRQLPFTVAARHFDHAVRERQA
jgi:hypothetical protein